MKLALALVTVLSISTAAHAEQVDFAPMALNSLGSVPRNIASAPVMDQSGQVIGKVERIVADHDCKPSAMSYTNASGKLVLVAAVAVSYDGQRHLLVTADAPQRVASR
jgi:hypothetical protein